MIRRLKHMFAGVLPLSRVPLGIGKFADICNDVAKGGGDDVVRQNDWLRKLPLRKPPRTTFTEKVNDWFGLFAEPDDFTRGRYDA